MCGILGIKSPLAAQINLEQINNLQFHRGPDDFGLYQKGQIALAARRLSIIDLQMGHQPISNEDQRLWLVCNGEIINAPDLRRSLEAKGHHFKTNTDIEVILHGYEENAEQIISRLRGMYAFALWDDRQQKLFLGRDRFGIKPLCYAWHNDRFAFSSEISPLLELLPEIPRRANLESLWRLMELGFIPGTLTAFNEIYRLPAAHWMTIQDGRIKTECYWKPEFPQMGEERKISFNQAANEFIDCLKELVQAWKLSDVPVGSLLSGGIDSSSLAVLLSDMSEDPIHTFNLGFEAGSLDESVLAQQTAHLIGSKHLQSRCTMSSLDLLPRVVRSLEEPHSSTSLSLFLIFQSVHETGLKVVMTGEGADELLGGYPWYRFDERVQPILNLGSPISVLLSRSPLVTSPDIRRVLQFGSPDVIQRFVMWQRGSPTDQISNLLISPQFSPYHEVLQAEYGHAIQGLHPFHQMLFIESRTRLVDFINFQLDRMSMAHSVEARPVYLDHLLWEFTANLPPQYKLAAKFNKYLLRFGMRNHLPKSVIERPKKGLVAPQGSWWRKPRLPDWAEECLTSSSLTNAGYFFPDEVTRLRKLHLSGQANHSTPLTNVLTTQLWHNLFIRNN